MLDFLDTVADSGANGIRVFGFFPFGKSREEEPYVRTNAGFNLDNPNTRYFEYLRTWMDHAQQRGIVVLYELFDSVGIKYKEVGPYHPFGRFVQHEDEHHNRLKAFSTLGGELERRQKDYLTHVVNILKPYPNVVFGVMNEFIGDSRWHEEMSRHIKTLAPNHLLSGSEEDSGEGWISFS